MANLPPSSYCALVKDLPADHPHRVYHDRQYGFPISDDNELFGRLILEINQAGLNWLTILKKQQSFREAYAGFNISEVARFKDEDIAKLLANPGIIRNKLKIKAAIHNAQEIEKIQTSHGSFLNWLLSREASDLQAWLKIFKGRFKFVGPEIVNEFLMSCGFIAGAHQQACPLFSESQQMVKKVYQP